MRLIPKFLRKAVHLFDGMGRVRYVRKKSIADGQLQLRKLKAQVEELNERLCSLETMADAVGVEFRGPGPFRLPLLTHFKSLISEVEGNLVTVFELPDRELIYARIPYLAAAQLVNDDVSLPLQNVSVDPSTAIELRAPINAFRLPLLAHYEGYFYAGHNTKVVAFLTQESQRVYFPLSTETYEMLVRRFEDALAPHVQTAEADIDTGVPYPLRYSTKERE